MTPSQETEFNSFGCSCRCLIALANANGIRITKPEFIDRFSKHPHLWFWNAQSKCGLTDTGLVLDIIRELKLGVSCQILINKHEVRRRMQSRLVSGVLLFTEKREEEQSDGSTVLTEYFHCNLISSHLGENGEFLLIPVGPDCKPESGTFLTDARIDDLKGYFMLILPEVHH